MEQLKYTLFSLFRQLPLFKGKTRLAKALVGSYIQKAKNVTIKGRHGIKYLVPNLVENIGFDLMLNGIYEPDTVSFIIERIPANAVFFDIGANIGAITLPIVNKRKDINVVCVEASPRVFAYLQKNIPAGNNENIILIHKAVTEQDDQALHFYSPEELFGKGSRAAVYTNEAETVQTITFRTLYTSLKTDRPSFVKVDVEGFEYDVFKGGEEIFSRKDAPDIIFEFMEWAETQNYSKAGLAQQLLRDYGYNLYKIGDHNKLSLIENILTKDDAMIFATKNVLAL